MFGIFAALAEFERELIRERTLAGLSSARACGRNGGRPYTMTPAKLRLAQAAMAKRDTKVGDLCKERGGPQRAQEGRYVRYWLSDPRVETLLRHSEELLAETARGVIACMSFKCENETS